MSNKVAPSPFYDILKQLKSEIFADLRVCLPGSIADLNPVTGTVVVQLGVMQNIQQTNYPKGLDFAYPQLIDCPVFTVQGGGVGAVMPVNIGDQCLVIFSDRAIDNWITTGEPNPLPSLRMHSVSDAFVLVGLNTLANPLKTSLVALNQEGGLCETDATVIGSGAKVTIQPSTHKISISNGVGGANSLGLILTTLFTALETDPGLSAGSHAALATAITNLTALLY